MSDSEPVLNPCPCCGGQAQYSSCVDYILVFCQACGLETSKITTNPLLHGEAHRRTQAAELWNARTPAIRKTVGRRIVCAAIQNGAGEVICSARHYDANMHRQVRLSKADWSKEHVLQGFVDQNNVFLTREEAYVIAKAEGQIIMRCGGDGHRLYTENLY